MKRCVLILPYFGKFGNYFQYFLNSFAPNNEFELIIFTDNKENYIYPENVKVIDFSLLKIKKILEEKIGFKVCLETPYKLCDYKPAYGLIFEEYIKDYEYWGHCDCDLLFGDLNKIILPLLDMNYDKLFAAGHLTLYKNTYENNRIFMQDYKYESIYKEAFTTNAIYVFDEDYKERNVHRIFLEHNKKVYEEDLCMNPTSKRANFRRSYYCPKSKMFEWEPVKNIRYYWTLGKIISIEKQANYLKQKEYSYMHLQGRKMHIHKDLTKAQYIEILPDKLKEVKSIPNICEEFKNTNPLTPNLFWFDVYIKKIKNKLERIKIK